MSQQRQKTQILDLSGGLVNSVANPLDYPTTALITGKNCEIGRTSMLRTRKGTAVNATFGPGATIKAIQQVRFPTNETSYIVVQTSNTPARAGWPRSSYVSCVYEGIWYIWGGIYSGDTWTEYVRPYLNGYHFASGTWAELGSCDHAPGANGNNAAMIGHNGKLYIFGGGEATLDIYDIATKEWSAGADGPASPSTVLAKAYGDYVYFVTSQAPRVVYAYQISTNTWQASDVWGGIDEWNIIEGGGIKATADGFIIGPTEQGDPVVQYWGIYSPVTNTWTNTTVDQGCAPDEGGPTYGTSPMPLDGHTYQYYSDGGGEAVGDEIWMAVDAVDGLHYTVTTTNHFLAVGDDTGSLVHYDGRLYYFGGISEDGGEVAYATGLMCIWDMALETWTTEHADFELTSDPPVGEECTLWACPDNLPDATMEFTAIYDLGTGAGPVSIAVLNDRAVITEGVAEVPLVFPGCMSADGSDWAVPKAVLARQDGTNAYDVSAEVCDKDTDTVADVGNINKWGDLLICCDMPKVEAFYVQMGTANTGVGISSFATNIDLDALTKISQRDLKGGIARWYQDAAAAGHFEGAAKTLAGAAVDLGGSPNTVKIPCATHGFVAGNVVEIRNTTNYDGTYTLPTQTGGDASNFVIQSAYNAETFASPDEARLRLTLGAGNNAPLVEAGLWIEFAADTVDIVSVTDDGEAASEVELSVSHVTADITAIYGLEVEDAGVQVNRADNAWADSFLVTPAITSNFGCGGFHYRIKIPASELDYDGTKVRLTFQAETGQAKGAVIRHCSIGVAGTGPATTATPTVVTFNDGDAGATIATGSTVTSDAVTFTIDEATTNVIVCLDMDGSFSPGAGLGAGSGSGTYTPGTNTGGLAYVSGISGAITYHYERTGVDASAYDTYNLADPSTIWPTNYITATGYVVGLIKIETNAIAAIPTGLYIGHTTGDGTLDVTYANAITGVEVTENKPGSSIAYHAVSIDSSITWKVFLSAAWRDIARLNAGTTWQYNNSATATPSWQAATTNTIFGALSQAFAVAQNQMDGDALTAIAATTWDDIFVPFAVSELDFAWALQSDGNNYPRVDTYAVTYTFGDITAVEGWLNGDWSEGSGWTDGTEVTGVPLAQSGIIDYDGATPFEADYSTICDVPGYWYRLVMGGTSAGTTITRILYKAPCQPLSNIGDGQPDIPMRFIYYNGTTGAVVDYSDIVSDWVDKSEFSKADVPLTTSDYLYVGYLTRFFECEITPYIENNSETSALTAEYWNGDAWSELTMVDGSSLGGATLATQGKITWSVPSDWRMTVPLTDTWYPRGYYIRISVSSSLSSTTAISELRVRGIPDALKKHKEAVAVRDRIALINRPDAPDQVDLSRVLEEFGFSGPASLSTRIGGLDGIAAVCQAWNTLLVSKTETWHALNDDFSFSTIEAAQCVPVNSRVIVKAAYNSPDGDRYGLFFLNRTKAVAVSGIQADNTYGTLRAQDLSQGVNWWSENTSILPRLDLNNLHTACGTFWAPGNQILWAVPMITAVGQTEQTSNNRVLVYDLNLGAWLPPWEMTVSCLTTAYHYSADAPGKLGALGLYGGNYTGEVLRLLDATTDDGTAIEAEAKTGYLHCGYPGIIKKLWKIRLFASTDSTDGITVTAYVDGETAACEQATLQRAISPVGKEFVVDYTDMNIDFNFIQLLFSFTGPTDIYGVELEWTGFLTQEGQE